MGMASGKVHELEFKLWKAKSRCMSAQTVLLCFNAATVRILMIFSFFLSSKQTSIHLEHLGNQDHALFRTTLSYLVSSSKTYTFNSI